MEHILFMNDMPIAVVIGNEEFRALTLDKRKRAHWENNDYQWENFESYERQIYWHYHDVERIIP